MKRSDRLVKNDRMVARCIDGEVILIPVFPSSDAIACVYSLNACAARVWELINGKRTYTDIKEQILEEFDTSAETAENEFKKLIAELREINAIA